VGQVTPVRILMVEDNEPDAYLVRTALRAAQIDFELTHAKDGLSALAMLDDASAKSNGAIADLIFLDLNMPQIDGFALLTAMRQHPASADVPIAVLSSSLSHDDMIRSMKLGANRYIVKPIELNEFITLIAGTVTGMLKLQR
jgi:chemotaxis family two-component system response regulator Rcp1